MQPHSLRRLAALAAVTLTFLIPACALGAGAAASPAVPFGAALSSVGTGACVDAAGASTATGFALTQAPCTVPAEQSFSFLTQADGSVIVHAPGSFSLCVDVNDSGLLVQNYCLPTASQRWMPNTNGNGTLSLVNQQKSQCLTTSTSGYSIAVCSPGTTMQEFSFLNSHAFAIPAAPLKPIAPVAPVAAASVGQWQAGMFQGLPYRILFPAGYDPTRYVYSLALFLSGAGELGTDNLLQLRNDMGALATDMDFRAKVPMILLAPQCPSSDYWGSPSNFTPTSTEALTIKLVQALASALPVDATRITVTGLSLGSIGTWDMINRYPAVFAAAAPIAGAGNILDAQNLLRTPILAVHGGADTVIPPTYDEAMYQLIHAQGGPMIYFEAPGYGHDVWDGVYPLTSFWQWMMAQVHS